MSKAGSFSSLASSDLEHCLMRLALGRWEVHYFSNGMSCFCDILRLMLM